MNKTHYDWKSAFSHHLKAFVAERQLAGYRFRVQERWIKQFDGYCYEMGIDEGHLTKESLEGFCKNSRGESTMTQQQRLRLLRQFAMYLLKNGYDIELPPASEKAFAYPTHNPYIFTERELKRIFIQADNWVWTSQSRGNRKQVDPLLFRMIYGCGLRVMEALRLKVADVHLKEGYLHVQDSKNGRSRNVPMADRLTFRCQAYSTQMHPFSSPDDYYFPGSTPGRHSSHSAVYHRFREYLWKAGIPHTGNGPRIHDLRHTFCVHRFKKWALACDELSHALPYLSAYLGHADFRGTEYYLRLTADLYPEIISKLECLHGSIIPQRSHDNG